MPKEIFQVEFTSDIVPLIAKRRQDASRRLKEIIVIELFREGKISTGKAGQILGINRLDFISLISRMDVPYFNQDKEELSKEFSQA